MMLLLPLLLCFLVVDAGPGYGPRYGSSSTSRHWGIIPRGGGEETQSRQKVAVGLVRQAASSDSSQSAIFYSDNGQIYTSSTLAPDATETLAVTSDVLLLVVEPTTASWDVTDSIVRGAKRRRDAGFPKLAVVVVLRGIDDNDNEMDRILAQQFADFTPTLVASLDIVSEQNAQAVYQDVIENLPVPSGGDIVVADEEEYKLLIQQVYESLTNTPCDDLTFEPADESFFESQEEEPAEESFFESQEEPEEESFFESQEETSTELSVTTDTETEAETEPEIELEIEIVSEQDSQGVKHNLLVDAMAELESLEAQQEEVWLSSDAQVPLLHFGSAANSVLDKVSNAVQQAPDNVREAILQKVAGKLQVLYHNQLQSLREQFGRRYEAALDENPDNDQAQADAAARITQGFRAAAQHAIPEQCREGQALVNADFSYVSVLQGLVSDMMEATSMRQDMDDTAVEEEEEENKPAKWYKKLAARAVMVGINYIQGWLAWQGIKKAAAQRDKDMPKFPLF